MKRMTGVLAALLLTVFLSPVLSAQDAGDTADDSKDEMMEELEDVLKEGEDGTAGTGDDAKGEGDLEETNRSLNDGAAGPSGRRRQNPGKLLKRIINEMDAAAKSLEANTREMVQVRRMLKKMQKSGTGDARRKELRKKIKKLFRAADDREEQASDDLKEIVKLKKKFKSAQSAQKNTMVNLERLIRMAQKQKKSGKGGGKKKKRRKKGQAQKPKPKQGGKKSGGGKKKGSPASSAYEASSNDPSKVKERSGKTSDWGNLPPKVREAIIQRRNEEYVPGYADRLRNYYKKIGAETEE